MKNLTLPGIKTYIAAALLAAWAVIEPSLADGSLVQNADEIILAAGLAGLRAAISKAMAQVEQLNQDLGGE